MTLPRSSSRATVSTAIVRKHDSKEHGKTRGTQKPPPDSATPPLRQPLLEPLQRKPLGLRLEGLTASPLRGPAGNIEFLATWTRGEPQDATTVFQMIADAIAAAPER